MWTAFPSGPSPPHARRLLLPGQACAALCLQALALCQTLRTRSNMYVRNDTCQFSLSARPTLCDPTDCSTPGLPVHHQLPEPAQTHVHRLSDAVQPSHPLSSLLLLPSIFPSIRVFSNESALCIRWPKYWSFSFSVSPSNEYSGLGFPLGWTGWISSQSKGLSRVFSNTTIQKHQFFDIQLSLWFNSHIRK